LFRNAIIAFGAAFLILAIIFWHGLRRGRSVMGLWLSADRKTNPVGFWFGQAFIAAFALAALAVVLFYGAMSMCAPYDCP
jgi:hypothetical protein